MWGRLHRAALFVYGLAGVPSRDREGVPMGLRLTNGDENSRGNRSLGARVESAFTVVAR